MIIKINNNSNNNNNKIVAFLVKMGLNTNVYIRISVK